MTDKRLETSSGSDIADQNFAQYITSDRIRQLAEIGLQKPSKLTFDEIRELSGAVISYILGRGRAG